MCYAVPMKVISVDGNTALVEIGGAHHTIELDLLEHKPDVGQYVLVHAGFAINIVDEAELQIPVDDFEELLTNDKTFS